MCTFIPNYENIKNKLPLLCGEHSFDWCVYNETISTGTTSRYTFYIGNGLIITCNLMNIYEN